MSPANPRVPNEPSQSPRVSVIVNNYNYGRFLGQAIQSALGQTYGNKEVIVVDDGSTDESRAIVESFGTRIRAIFQNNGGQGSAYNTGFAASSGDLIHFLDADDFLMPTAIQEAVGLWEPGVSKVHFYLRVIEGQEGRLSDACVPSGRLSAGDVTAEILATGSYTSPPASGNLYSRHALEQLLPMPAENWITAADLYCIFQAPFFGEVRSISRQMGFYRVHGNNIDAGTLVSAKLLRYRLTNERKRDTLLYEFCEPRGIPYIREIVTRSVPYLKVRFASCLLDPDLHPYKEDTRYSLFRRLVLACSRDRGTSTMKKLLFLTWSIALFASRGELRSKLLAFGFAPITRPRIVQHILSFAAEKQEPAGSRYASADAPSAR